MAKSKTAPKKAKSDEKQAKALELRIMGWRLHQIAKALGVSEPRAHQYVTNALADLAKLKLERADDLRRIELEKLDRMEAHLNADGLDAKTVSALLAISDRRCRLLGLDAPSKVEATGKDGQPLSSGVLLVHAPMSLDEWESKAPIVTEANK